MNRTIPKDYTCTVVQDRVENPRRYDLVKMHRKECAGPVIVLRSLADVEAARFAIALFESRNGVA